MTSNQPMRRRFRIEALEERVAATSLFWLDSLSDRMAVEWATNIDGNHRELSLSATSEMVGMPQSSALLGKAASIPAGNSHAFPAWAEDLLKQVDQDLENNARPGSHRNRDAQRSMRLDEIINLVHPPEAESGQFPAWAEELLAQVDERLGTAAKSNAMSRNHADKLERLDEIMNAVCQADPESTHFPEWAEDLLAEVDRRLEMTATMDAHQLSRLDAVMEIVCEPQTERDQFPVWAEKLLGEVDRRLEMNSDWVSTHENDADPSTDLDHVLSMIRRPETRRHATVS